MPTTRSAAAVLLMASALALSGCGRKGDPEYPQGTQMEQRSYSDGSTKKQPKKPTRPFVLDGLLN